VRFRYRPERRRDAELRIDLAWMLALRPPRHGIAKAVDSPRRLEILEVLAQGPRTVESLAR